jgi:hypothetical protein
MSENLQSAYQGLTDETQTFLREEVRGETELKLRDFSNNVSEAIEELKKPIKAKKECSE